MCEAFAVGETQRESTNVTGEASGVGESRSEQTDVTGIHLKLGTQ